MISQESLQIIHRLAQELFEKIEAPSQIQARQEEGSTVALEVTLVEPQLFIGEKGQTLLEIQHLLRALVRKKIPEPVFVSLDINEYRKNKESYLRELAQNTADEVSLLKKPKELPPMPAFERRIIHVALAERSDVTSASEGEGEDRRVIIQPKPKETGELRSLPKV